MKMDSTKRFLKIFGPITVTSRRLFDKETFYRKDTARTFSLLRAPLEDMPVEKHAMYTLDIVDICAGFTPGARYSFIGGQPYPIIYSVEKKLDYWIAQEWHVNEILKYMQEERGVAQHDVLIVDYWRLRELHPYKSFGVSPKILEFCNMKYR